jgi:hypothetical protein
MPGLLDAGEVERLGSTEASSFVVLFLELMTRHHAGAVAMADAQLRDGSDPRLRIMAQAIRHEQQGEIALMHGMSGGGAVSAAFRNMFVKQLESGKYRRCWDYCSHSAIPLISLRPAFESGIGDGS